MKRVLHDLCPSRSFIFRVKIAFLDSLYSLAFVIFAVQPFSELKLRVNVSVKSKLQHAPPRAYPGHLTPLPSRGGGNLIIRVFQGVGNLIPML